MWKSFLSIIMGCTSDFSVKPSAFCALCSHLISFATFISNALLSLEVEYYRDDDGGIPTTEMEINESFSEYNLHRVQNMKSTELHRMCMCISRSATKACSYPPWWGVSVQNRFEKRCALNTHTHCHFTGFCIVFIRRFRHSVYIIKLAYDVYDEPDRTTVFRMDVMALKNTLSWWTEWSDELWDKLKIVVIFWRCASKSILKRKHNQRNSITTDNPN